MLLTDKQKNIIIAVGFLIILILIFYLGYRAYPKFNPTVTQSDTILIHDTVTHHIIDSFPYPITEVDSIKYRDQAWMDSVIKVNKVDSAKILQDYYALHYYSRELSDSLLEATLKYMITENKPIFISDFSYKILRPQEVINNVINNYSYSRYLYFGLSLNIPEIKNSDFGLFYAGNKWYGGIGYSPGLNEFSLKGGIKIIKFK